MVRLHVVDQETDRLHELVHVALRQDMPVLENEVDQRLQRAEFGEDHRDFIMDAGVITHYLVVGDSMGHGIAPRISSSIDPKAT